MAQKRVRVGGGLVSDPQTVEVRDTYFVSLEKGIAGASGRDPDNPISLSGALSLAKGLDSGTKGQFGTKLYLLPTTTSQDGGADNELSKNNLSLEGVSVGSRRIAGALSGPSIYTDDANAMLFIIAANMVEIVGISMNAKAGGGNRTNTLDLIGTYSSGVIYKPLITQCRFHVDLAGSAIASPTLHGNVIGINFRNEVHLAEVSNNVFLGCSDTAVRASDLHNSLIVGNHIMASGIEDVAVQDGIYVTGNNITVDSNILNAGRHNGSRTGILISGDECLSSNNIVTGFSTATNVENSRNDTTS